MKRSEIYSKLSQLLPATIASFAWELIGAGADLNRRRVRPVHLDRVPGR